MRDRVLAQALYNRGYDVEILCSEPALSYARHWGLKIHSNSYDLDSISDIYSSHYLSKEYRGFSLKLIRMINRVVNNNIARIAGEIDIEGYEAVVADESWELMKIFAGRLRSRYSGIRKIMITDFIFFKPTSIAEIPSAAMLNLFLMKSYRSFDLKLNVGLRGIAPRYGFIDIGLLPPVLRSEMLEKEEARKALKLGHGYLILFSLGGTAAGIDLTRKIIRSVEILYEEVRKKDSVSLVIAPGSEANKHLVEMILREGSWRIDIEILENMYSLPRFVRAFDVIISPAGLGSISLMISSGVPGIVFPSRRHFEQEENARIAPKIWEGIASLEDLHVDERQVASLLKTMISAKHKLPPDIHGNVEKAVNIIESLIRGRNL